MFVRQRRTVVAACAAAAGIALGAPAGAQALTSGDAYANQDANACSWTMGTAGIEKVVAFAGGAFEMTSLKNKVASPSQELVQGTTDLRRVPLRVGRRDAARLQRRLELRRRRRENGHASAARRRSSST